MDNLPEEILLEISKRLDNKSFGSFCVTCKTFANLETLPEKQCRIVKGRYNNTLRDFVKCRFFSGMKLYMRENRNIPISDIVDAVQLAIEVRCSEMVKCLLRAIPKHEMKVACKEMLKCVVINRNYVEVPKVMGNIVGFCICFDSIQLLKEIVEILDIDLEYVRDYDNCAWRRAMLRGNVKMAKYLSSFGLNVEDYRKKQSILINNILLATVRKGNVDSMKYLVSLQYLTLEDLRIKDRYILKACVKRNNINMMKYLKRP